MPRPTIRLGTLPRAYDRAAASAAREALLKAVADSMEEIQAALRAYEVTGDHDHGAGPICVGGRCSGGDCLVARTRKLVADAIQTFHGPVPR